MQNNPFATLYQMPFKNQKNHYEVPLSLCSSNFSVSCHRINICLNLLGTNPHLLFCQLIPDVWFESTLYHSQESSCQHSLTDAQYLMLWVSVVFLLIDISQRHRIIEFSKFHQMCHGFLAVSAFYPYRALSSGIFVLPDYYF